MTFLESVQVNSQMHRSLRTQKDNLFAPVAKLCQRLGISANTVTAIGFGIGVLSIPLLFINYWWFVILFLVSTLADGVDGALARLQKTTSHRGAQLDYAVDLTLTLLISCGLIIWLQQPLWVLGLNMFGVLLLSNAVARYPLQIAPLRVTLLTCCLFGLPQIGLALLSAYSVVMFVYLLTKLGKKK